MKEKKGKLRRKNFKFYIDKQKNKIVLFFDLKIFTTQFIRERENFEILKILFNLSLGVI